MNTQKPPQKIPPVPVTLTTNPRQKPPADALVFGKYFTDYMFVMDFGVPPAAAEPAAPCWHSPRIVPYAPFEIDPAAMVFHYGQAVFEGLKAYKAKDGRVLLFRPQENFKRLNDSNERMCIPPVDETLALAALKQLIKLDEAWIPTAPNTSLYIRPFIIASEASLGVRPAAQYNFLIILSPVGPYYAEGLNCVKIFVEDDYVRSVQGLTGHTKASANYSQSLKGQLAAKEKGYTQVLWLDAIHRKYIEEVGTMNIFFKIKGRLVTPKLTGSILPGITRRSVIELAKKRGVETDERLIDIDEIFTAAENGELEEVFGTGTAAVVSPVGELCRKERRVIINGGEIGPFAKMLYDTLVGIQYGTGDDPFGWSVSV